MDCRVTGTVWPAVRVHGWQVLVVSSPHTYQHCEQSAKLGVLQASKFD